MLKKVFESKKRGHFPDATLAVVDESITRIDQLPPINPLHETKLIGDSVIFGEILGLGLLIDSRTG